MNLDLSVLVCKQGLMLAPTSRFVGKMEFADTGKLPGTWECSLRPFKAAKLGDRYYHHCHTQWTKEAKKLAQLDTDHMWEVCT